MIYDELLKCRLVLTVQMFPLFPELLQTESIFVLLGPLKGHDIEGYMEFELEQPHKVYSVKGKVGASLPQYVATHIMGLYKPGLESQF